MKILGSCLLAAVLGISAMAQQPKAPPPQTHLKVGDKAPDFVLKDTGFKDVKLSDFKGKTVVLAFYVFAFTGG